MRGFRRSLLVGLTAGAFAAVALAGSAGAQSYASTLTATTENCSQLSVSGSDWRPGDTVTISISSTPTVLGAVLVDSAGAFSGSFKLAKSLGDGSHVVTANGPGTPPPEVSGPAVPVAKSVGVTLTGCATAAGTGALAVTGSDAVPWAMLGIGFVVAGMALAVVTYRRRTAHSLGI